LTMPGIRILHFSGQGGPADREVCVCPCGRNFGLLERGWRD
jgi:hypothetical protein